MKAANEWYWHEANLRLDVVDFAEQAFIAGVLFAAQFSEDFREDRFGKLERFQIADGLRGLVNGEES